MFVNDDMRKDMAQKALACGQTAEQFVPGALAPDTSPSDKDKVIQEVAAEMDIMSSQRNGTSEEGCYRAA